MSSPEKLNIWLPSEADGKMARGNSPLGKSKNPERKKSKKNPRE